jgi:hypothetical protein
MEIDVAKLRRDLRRYRRLRVLMGDPLGLLILEALMTEARHCLRRAPPGRH